MMWLTKTLDPTAPNLLSHFETHCHPVNQKVCPPLVNLSVNSLSYDRFGLELHLLLDIRRIYASEIVGVAKKKGNSCQLLTFC